MSEARQAHGQPVLVSGRRRCEPVRALSSGSGVRSTPAGSSASSIWRDAGAGVGRPACRPCARMSAICVLEDVHLGARGARGSRRRCRARAATSRRWAARSRTRSRMASAARPVQATPSVWATRWSASGSDVAGLLADLGCALAHDARVAVHESLPPRCSAHARYPSRRQTCRGMTVTRIGTGRVTGLRNPGAWRPRWDRCSRLRGVTACPCRSAPEPLVDRRWALALGRARPRRPAPPRGRSRRATCAAWCSSATTGRAPSTCSRPGTFERLGRINMIPDQDARMMEIATNPERLAYYLAIRRGHRRGPRPARRRHVHLQRRPAADRVAAVVRRRGRDQPRGPARSCGGSRSPASARTTWRSRRTASSSSSAPRPPTSCTCCGSPTARELGTFPSGGSPHENVFIDGGEADPARQHRLRLHADRPGPRRPREGRAGLRDRRREDAVQGAAPLRPAQGARRARSRRPQHRRTADDAVAEREEDLLPAVVLPRLPRDVAAHRQDPAGQAPAEPDPGHPARAVPPRLRPPRHRDEPARHARSASPGPCPTTRPW